MMSNINELVEFENGKIYRPFNEDELEGFIGKVVTITRPSCDECGGCSDDKECNCMYDTAKFLVTGIIGGEKIVINEKYVTPFEFLMMFTLDGKPCGVEVKISDVKNKKSTATEGSN